MNDNINHPKHYEDAGYLAQPIDVCQELPFRPWGDPEDEE